MGGINLHRSEPPLKRGQYDRKTARFFSITRKRVKPAIILLDIQIPVMDGYAVARELRKRPGFANTPIVAVTSYAMAGDRERILKAGCSGYIEKPINPETFIADIEQYLPTL